jgi:hypothetical protein
MFFVKIGASTVFEQVEFVRNELDLHPVFFATLQNAANGKHFFLDYIMYRTF